jgi:hypothetical protein
MQNLRKVETLGEDRKTVNIWEIPNRVSLINVLEKQDRPKFREKYFHSQRAL